MSNRKMISIVTPCYNEEENVQDCYEAIRNLFATTLKDYDYEHIFCDNASSDRTVELLEPIAKADPRVKVIVNANNFGFLRSMFNGVIATSGDA
ncbi:MAG TPA: glycosyltransferase, partial [Bdellovibrio sp.]|nr:glycosyltransferase [Bdellovibrio sp.]